MCLGGLGINKRELEMKPTRVTQDWLRFKWGNSKWMMVITLQRVGWGWPKIGWDLNEWGSLKRKLLSKGFPRLRNEIIDERIDLNSERYWPSNSFATTWAVVSASHTIWTSHTHIIYNYGHLDASNHHRNGGSCSCSRWRRQKGLETRLEGTCFFFSYVYTVLTFIYN